jgi:hypothetical protein
MSSQYARRADSSVSAGARRDVLNGSNDEALEDAAKALRAAEVEAVRPETPVVEGSRLEGMCIDELRKLAAVLDVPDRGQIIEQEELIAAIRERL